MMEWAALRAEIATAVRILHEAGLIRPFGHVSARTGDGRVAILSHLHGSDRSPATVTAADVTLVNLDGEPVTGMDEPPEEVFLHTEIYRRRPEVQAVAHFHPFHVVSLSVSGQPVLPVNILCGPFAPAVPLYASPEQIDSPASGAQLAEFLGTRQAAVLRWHGALTCGASIAEATVLALNLEEAARMQLTAAGVGTAEPVGGAAGFPPSYAGKKGGVETVWAYRSVMAGGAGAGAGAASGAAAAAAAVAGPELAIAAAAFGHWHVGHGKALRFSVTGAGGPVDGLTATVTMTSVSGWSSPPAAAKGEGGGAYSAVLRPLDMGSTYAHPYIVTLGFVHQSHHYSQSWPAEVCRDGNEGIMVAASGTSYCYQVRYSWLGAEHRAGAPVTMFFEPRRAVQTGDQLNLEKPWLNTVEVVPGLQAVAAIRSADGELVAEVPAAYVGLGTYKAQYTFAPAAVGGGQEYRVSLVFTDPVNDARIGEEHQSYPLVVGGAA